jgi:hypothetical protein
MKKLSMIAVMLLVGCISAFAQPKLVIEGGDTYDWGTIKQPKEPLKATIKLRNEGTDTLKITDVKPGCGCTTAPLDKNVLLPNETATMSVTLNVGSSGGHINKVIRVMSNDPINKDRTISLKANIFLPFTVTPIYFNYPGAEVGKESSAIVKVKNNTETTVHFTGVEPTPATMIVGMNNKTEIKPGEEIDVTTKITPVKAGSLSVTLRIKTDDKDMPVITISGWGQVKESPILNNMEAK